MDALVLILLIIFWLKFTLIAAMRPAPSPMSRFELKRRAKMSKRAKAELDRDSKLGSIVFIQRMASSLMMLAAALLSVVYFGWLGGVLVSVLVIVLSAVLITHPLVARLADRIYGWLEPTLLKIAARGESVLKHVNPPFFYDVDRYRRLDSKEDLIHLIQGAEEALTDSQRRIISSTLDFEGKLVSQIMTPRSSINSVKKDEFLGPLVLDELHSLGNSRLPVIDGDLDHIVGILYLRDLLSLDVRNSAVAEEVMDKKVHYINQSDTLGRALTAFLKVRHHLFIVINDARETVGILSLEDVIETLIGQKIVDEDDRSDAGSTAKKNDNNQPKGRVDV